MAPATALLPYLELRSDLERTGWRAAADRLLADTLTRALAELADPVPPGVAVLAVGGFGRGSLALRSDVDLMILHGGTVDDLFVRRFLRPLWDAGLKVGHSTRTPRAARDFAASRLDALCPVLTRRLVSGDADVAADFDARFDRLVAREHRRIVDALGMEESARRQAEPRRLMAMDLKRGRGGVRCLDLVQWRSRLDEATGRPPLPTTPDEAEARATLVSIRSALHAVMGRAHDTWDFELREPAASWLGSAVADVGTRLLVARRRAEGLVTDLWPALGAAPPPPVTLRPDDPTLTVVARRMERGRPVLPEDIVGRGPGGTPPSPGDRTAFLALTAQEAEPALTALLDSGWADRFLPEWTALRDVPHLVAFHRFAVIDHTLATVAEVRRLIDGDPTVPIVAEILPHLGDPEAMLWAALLHDVGKAAEGEHTRAGVPLARRAAERLGLAEIGVVVGVVENHLVLAELATRSDVEDPAVISRAADRIGDLDILRNLYLLTVADSRATGSDTWSAWRADLVRRAFRALERELTRRSLPEEARIAVLTEQVMASVGGSVDRAEVESHLAGLTDVYRSSHTADVIAEHVALARVPLGPGGMGLSATAGEATLRIVVTAADRPGLLTMLAGVLALERLSIIDARFASRSDGRVFDTFEVVDGLTGERPGQERVSAVEARLQRVLRGGFDLESALLDKQRAYRQTERAGVAPVVSVTPVGEGRGVVDIEGSDRLGLLHDLGAVFARYAMPVSRARVDTRGGVAYDTFHVERLPADTSGLEEALLDVL